MHHWPFIIAAYGMMLTGTIGVTVWSYAIMKARENKAASLREGFGE